MSRCPPLVVIEHAARKGMGQGSSNSLPGELPIDLPVRVVVFLNEQADSRDGDRTVGLKELSEAGGHRLRLLTGIGAQQGEVRTPVLEDGRTGEQADLLNEVWWQLVSRLPQEAPQVDRAGS